MNDKRDISINVPVLARVEGEGALELLIRNGLVEDLKLKIFEPPRYFEKFLEGRDHQEVVDMVARICGICPVAYQMSAVQAMENIFSVEPNANIRALRRVLYCGEWIESHALHIHLLAIPDFLGFTNVIEMAEQYPLEVKRGLKLQALGNKLIKLFGGRSVHPVGVRVGGFFRIPDRRECDDMIEQLKSALPDAEALVDWTANLELPNNRQSFTSVALHHRDEYAMNEGHIVSSQGLDISIDEYEQYFEEHQVPYSTAFHALLQGKPYLVGPLARVNLNWDQLPSEIKQCVDNTDISFPSDNMFHSVVARAIEIYFSLIEAIRILENVNIENQPVSVRPRSGIGFGCTEAPRGILWHRYELNDTGNVTKATIIPPTSQNQARIEQDIKYALENYDLNKSDEDICLYAESIIRNYDPCISCSTHFLNLKLQRQ